MIAAEKFDKGKRWATIAIYKECRRNHSPQQGAHVVLDGCQEFLGFGKDPRSEVAFYCSKCGCKRDFHRKEEITILAEPKIVKMVHEMATSRPPLQFRSTAPSPPLKLVPRGRTRFTEGQKEAMRGYAERLRWRLRGHNSHQLFRFCLGIGVTLRNFKVWVKNNKRKYFVEPEESSASCCSGL